MQEVDLKEISHKIVNKCMNATDLHWNLVMLESSFELDGKTIMENGVHKV
ncbi:MAG: hypothetical protein ACOC40_00400 [Thermoplasmatota archaeon]